MRAPWIERIADLFPAILAVSVVSLSPGADAEPAAAVAPAPAAAPAPAVTPASADAAIQRVIANWDRGWKDFDAEIVSRDYAEDAEWTNAFGISRKGRPEIRKFLADLFLKPEIRSRTSLASVSTIRWLRPDVAVASSYRETVGQRTRTGAEYPTRKTHDLRVLVQKQGKWVIVSHLIMDEKETRP